MDDIRLTLSEEEMKKMLKNLFKEEHAEAMSSCITELLIEDHASMNMVFKAAMGVSPKCTYSVGDRVIVKVNGLSDWDFNKEKMKEDNLLLDDNTMVVKIIGIRPYNAHKSYTAKYKYIDKNDGTMKERSQSVHTSYVISKADDVFPGEI